MTIAAFRSSFSSQRVKRFSTLLLMGVGLTAHASPSFTFLTNWYAEAEHGGFYEAKAKGLYEKQGLNVNIKMGGPSINPLQLLAANQAQCAISNDISIMLARGKGIPVKMVAAIFQYSPTVVITHSDIKSLAQLKGHTILISSASHISWWPWAKKKYGYTDSMARPYTFNIQPFMIDKSLAQQGFISSEPFALQKVGAHFHVFALGKYGYPPYGDTIACRDDIIKKHPEQVEAFIHASMLGWKDYLMNPAAGNKLIVQQNPNMTQAQLSYSLHVLKSSGLVTGGDAAKQGIGVIHDARVKKTWRMLVDEKLINPHQVIFSQTLTTQFVKQNPVMP